MPAARAAFGDGAEPARQAKKAADNAQFGDAFADLSNPFSKLTPMDQRISSIKFSNKYHRTQASLDGMANDSFTDRARGIWIAQQLVQSGCMVKCDRQRKRVRECLGERNCIAGPCSRALDVTELTEYKPGTAAATGAGVVPIIDIGEMMVAFALIKGFTLFDVQLRVAEFAGVAEGAPIQVMGLDQTVMIVHLLRQR